MTNLAKFMIIACLGVGASACAVATDLINQGRPYAARTAAELVQAECALPVVERKLNDEAVAALLLASNSPALFTLDCDGDGQKDF
jgi:hypothetical protein